MNKETLLKMPVKRRNKYMMSNNKLQHILFANTLANSLSHNTNMKMSNNKQKNVHTDSRHQKL